MADGPSERVYYCPGCGDHHSKPTGRKCQAKRPKPVLTTDLAGFMGEIKSLISSSNEEVKTLIQNTNERVASLEKAADAGVPQLIEPNEIIGVDLERNSDNGVSLIAQSNNSATKGVNPRVTFSETVPDLNHQEAAAMPQRISDSTSNVNVNGSMDKNINPEVLKRNAELVELTNRRLQELDIMDSHYQDVLNFGNNIQTRGKRSGSVSKASDQIRNSIDWPHFHVFRGINMMPSSYEEMSLEEFILGYVRMLRDSDSQFDNSIMLEMLENLMEDTIDFKWSNAKAFFRSVGLEIERGKLSWDNAMEIQKRRLIQCRVVKSTAVPSKPQPEVRKMRAFNPIYTACVAYQTSSCDKDHDHLPYVHACSFCYANRNQVCKPKEAQCFFKPKDSPKN